ncbi:1-phosphofructokinase [Bacillus cytotoxicus]|uniref:1-phosphofructokinase n=1 Tax=Bacillus cytotoxicus (strain DSM 22905 / CIP 110041 / 391-98 / NVH 391-98) TaxID=315749 RepID=A7GR75_BACCN|nr:1-phosphofructokinase [Bacillus cytotoxicus]ABS22633.1 1-phosphofructokinase [Bacillus cytotoxicus NVH 391-98]AWC45276.1 1-phosphofructokinase [Bacillus cytotoxicus]MDH2863859.1 1-phosphofructokinase [Bacillus cytotoxicus]MDH2886142.1 1-phosphofructokinase [Bacillus cytotoxicus]NZD34455.1 1-phosphofructokinase [Bacillus cytotoxicus]
MIYTVTLNPSIDYVVQVEPFMLGTVNRAEKDMKFPGGKGINVSRVLHRLGVQNIALGFTGGFTGEFIKSVLKSEDINTDFVQVDGDSRINVKIKGKEETELNGQGPIITEEQFQQLMKKFEKMRAGDFVVLAGSIPSSIPKNFYEQIAMYGEERGIQVVVDTSGSALKHVMKNNPFLLKPNHYELGELFGKELSTVEDILPYGKKLIAQGVQNVIVSMAGEGALLFTNDGVYEATVPKGQVVNSVGAGDSLVAGFVGIYEQTKDIIKAFQYGVATGSATAFSADLCTKDKVETLLSQVIVTKR